jgi:VWA domain-containing protein
MRVLPIGTITASAVSDCAGQTTERAEAVIMFPRERLSIWCCLGVLAGVNWLGIPAAQGQGDTSEVHIQPRGQMSPVNSATSDEPNAHTKQIRKNVDLVLVPVTLTDDLGRVVTGLSQDNFKVFEGKQQQEIKHFSLEDSPVSLGVILDLSSSMDSKIDRAREAVVEMLKSSNPQDEFFLITFADGSARHAGLHSEDREHAREVALRHA